MLREPIHLGGRNCHVAQHRQVVVRPSRMAVFVSYCAAATSLPAPTSLQAPLGQQAQKHHPFTERQHVPTGAATPVHPPLDKQQQVGPNKGQQQHIPPHGGQVPAGATTGQTYADKNEQSGIFTDADWDNLVKGYTSQHVEHDFWIDNTMIEGVIPAELEGTLLRNGPGLFGVGGDPIPHPFDGDGMVCSWAFRGGRCFFRNRFVRTDAFMAEQEAGRMLFRGAFSVGDPSAGRFLNPFDLRIKPIANTSVIHWAGRTFALHERDLPWELDSQLHTLGRSKLGNALAADSSPANFGAHVRSFREADGSCRLIGSTFEEGLTKGTLTFLELGEDMQLLHRTPADLPGGGFGFYHDMLVTEHYYVALENPMRPDWSKMVFQYSLGRACLAECLKFDGSRPTKIHLIPRPGRSGPLKERVTIETEPMFCFHHVNAFEAADGRVIMDCLAMDAGVDFSVNFGNLSSEFFQRAPWRTSLIRITLNPAQQTAWVDRLAEDQPWSLEMPNVAPSSTGRPYRHAFTLGSRTAGPAHWGPPQDIVKVTLPDATAAEPSCEELQRSKLRIGLERWAPGRDSFAQEPVFVPRPGSGHMPGQPGLGSAHEDDGWLLATVFRAASMTTDLVILDAADVAAGPVATVHLPLHIPIGLHGSFTKAYLGPEDRDNCTIRRFDIRNGASRNGVPRYSDAESDVTTWIQKVVASLGL